MPVLLGQADIQHDGVIGLGLPEEKTLFAVIGAIDGIAASFERGDELAIQNPCRPRHQKTHVRLLHKRRKKDGTPTLQPRATAPRPRRSVFISPGGGVLLVRSPPHIDSAVRSPDQPVDDAPIPIEQRDIINQHTLCTTELNVDGLGLRHPRSFPHDAKRGARAYWSQKGCASPRTKRNPAGAAHRAESETAQSRSVSGPGPPGAAAIFMVVASRLWAERS